MIRHMVHRLRIVALLALTAGVVGACAEETPTSLDEELLPREPITLELRFPWADFGSNLAVFGGYGSPSELGSGVLANTFAGSLNARTLVRYGAYPREVSVRDTTGTTRPDTLLTFIGGRVVAFLDTIASTNDGPVTLALGATQESWDATTVTWATAVDTINDKRAWTVPGGGGVTPLATSVWDPAEGDSVWFELDSTMVAAWADTTNVNRGAIIELLTVGPRLAVRGTVLRLNTRPSLNPDSTFFLVSPQQTISFVYDPSPDPPPDGIRVGGVPAWRTVLDVTIPTQLTGPAELCAVVTCPVTLDPVELNFAAIVFRSRQPDLAFQPTDTIGIDVRTVLNRAILPKAPLGSTLVGSLGKRIGPESFGVDAGSEVEIPITLFARDLVAGEDALGQVPTKTLALLSVFEPVSFSYASFYGPGTDQAPFLKLIVTIGRAVKLP